MKVIHLTYSDFIGGASLAADRIHKALISENIDSKIWANELKLKDFTMRKMLKRMRRFITWPLIKTLKTKIPIHHSVSLLPSSWLKFINESDADIVHLHWVNREMLSIKDIGEIKKPIIWTLHDMWAFCGAEHYTNDYRWKKGYHLNNRPKYETGFDLNRWTWERKKKFWKNSIQIVTPSCWLAKCAQESALMSGWPISVIPNPIDTNYWKPLDQNICREKLNLPKNIPLLLFGAVGGTKDPRKGFDLLISALKCIKKDEFSKKMELVVFGEKSKSKSISDFNVHFTGHVKNEEYLLNLYNSVNALVIPSRLDNLPNTGLEALACGLPVVAFNACGLTDIVKHQNTGYLAKAYEVHDLSKGIIWVIKNSKKNSLRLNSRKLAIDKFSFSLIAKKYKGLYHKLLNY